MEYDMKIVSSPKSLIGDQLDSRLSARGGPTFGGRGNDNTGSILIVVLWAVIFFSLVAVRLGVKAREQIHSLERFVRSARLKPLAYSGLSYAVNCFSQKDCQAPGEMTLPHGKLSLAMVDEQSKKVDDEVCSLMSFGYKN